MKTELPRWQARRLPSAERPAARRDSACRPAGPELAQGRSQRPVAPVLPRFRPVRALFREKREG